MTDKTRRLRRLKWIAAFASIVVAVGVCEGLLRLSLFHSRVELASRDPSFYARNADEFWIYHYLFSTGKQWAVTSGQPDASAESPVEFYRKWPTSLMPDAQLGYVRRPDVRTPCHETTSLATRGTTNPSPGRRRIVFFGDSFVESAACSNDTLTTKIEKLTGVDTLNFGIGGYGFDQIFLYFRRVLPTLDKRDSVFLIGLIQDDLGRILLKVRTSPKPYFTIANDTLILHTDHIHPGSLSDYFERPPVRFYLYYFLRARLGYPIYDAMMRETRDAGRQATYALSRLLIKNFAELRQQGGFDMAFVIFPEPGAAFDVEILSQLRAQGIPVVDLQSCLPGSNRPDGELYAEGHPTSLGNELLARCLVRDLTTMGLLE